MKIKCIVNIREDCCFLSGDGHLCFNILYRSAQCMQMTQQASIHSKAQLATIVEGDQNAPFSIATTLMCRGGCYSFPWIVPLHP